MSICVNLLSVDIESTVGLTESTTFVRFALYQSLTLFFFISFFKFIASCIIDSGTGSLLGLAKTVDISSSSLACNNPGFLMNMFLACLSKKPPSPGVVNFDKAASISALVIKLLFLSFTLFANIQFKPSSLSAVSINTSSSSIFLDITSSLVPYLPSLAKFLISVIDFSDIAFIAVLSVVLLFSLITCDCSIDPIIRPMSVVVYTLSPILTPPLTSYLPPFLFKF